MSLWLVGGATLSSVAFVGLVVAAAMRVRNLPARTGAGTVIGEEGVVRDPLDPVGTVQLPGELWTAVADETIPVGEHVVVDKVDGLRVHVKREA